MKQKLNLKDKVAVLKITFNFYLLTKSIFRIALVLYCFIGLITPSFLTNSANERANIPEYQFRKYNYNKAKITL